MRAQECARAAGGPLDAKNIAIDEKHNHTRHGASLQAIVAADGRRLGIVIGSGRRWLYFAASAFGLIQHGRLYKTRTAARALNITARRVRQLAEHDVFRRLPDGRYDVDECARALAVVRGGRGSPACRAMYDDIEHVTHVVERGLERLERLPKGERLAAARRQRRGRRHREGHRFPLDRHHQGGRVRRRDQVMVERRQRRAIRRWRAFTEAGTGAGTRRSRFSWIGLPCRRAATRTLCAGGERPHRAARSRRIGRRDVQCDEPRHGQRCECRRWRTLAPDW